MKNMAGIYRLVVHHPDGSRRFYIGRAYNFRKRRDQHMGTLRRNQHKNIELQRAFDELGKAAFAFEILLVCANNSEVLGMYEKAVMDSYDPSRLYNMCKMQTDTRLGLTSREETKRRISAANKGKKRTPEQRARISAAHRGRVVSAETRAKMSAAHKGNKYNLGKKLTEEHKAKVGAFFKGKKKSPEEVARRQASRAANRKSSGVGKY